MLFPSFAAQSLGLVGSVLFAHHAHGAMPEQPIEGQDGRTYHLDGPYAPYSVPRGGVPNPNRDRPSTNGKVSSQASVPNAKAPSVIHAPWSLGSGVGTSFKPRDEPPAHFFQPSNPTQAARNASIWLMKGYPRDYLDCLGQGLEPPKMIEVPQDVCLHGHFTNVTILLAEAAVCKDGSMPWLALYQDPTCHSFPYLINPAGIAPGTWCMWASPYWSETRIIKQFSVIFRCVETLEGTMPKKVMDAEVDEPVVEDPRHPPCCESSVTRAGTCRISRLTGLSEETVRMVVVVTILGSLALAGAFFVVMASLVIWSCISRLDSRNRRIKLR